MLYKRIIPLFLLKGQRLVKGMGFNHDFIDVGDPLSQAMIYDAQGAEEVLVVDISATEEARVIDPKIINSMINKCRLPIGAGGGIKNLEDARKCFQAGADKIVVNTKAVLNPGFVKELADEFGSQSVLVSVDVRKDKDDNYAVYVRSGKEKININLNELVKKLIDFGAGELMVTSIDAECSLSGFDYSLYRQLRPLVSVPLIASGGAGSYDDIVRLFLESDCDACSLGKMLFLRDYDIVRIKSYLKGRKIQVRDA